MINMSIKMASDLYPNQTITSMHVVKETFTFVAGRMVTRRHTNHIDNSQPRYYEKPPNNHVSQRSSYMVPAHTRSQRIRQGMVHVPD